MADHPNIFLPFSHLTAKIFYPGLDVKNLDRFEPKNLSTTIQNSAKELGFFTCILPQLSHSNRVHVLGSSDWKAHAKIESDSVIVESFDIAVAITHADCQAALLFDPQKNRFAAVHAGWRGLFSDIYIHTIEKMCERGSCPEDLLIFIGPSLGLKQSAFIHYEKEIPLKYHKKRVNPYLFDLKAIAKEQLLDCGLLEKNIEISLKCTAENPAFCSYRRAKQTGLSLTTRNYTICGLRSLDSPFQEKKNNLLS